jgi:hypothetical protein
MTRFNKPIVSDVATICGSMTTFDCKINEMSVFVCEKESLIAKVSLLEKQLGEMTVMRHSDTGKHASVVRKLNSELKADAKKAADAMAAAKADANAAAMAMAAAMDALKADANAAAMAMAAAMDALKADANRAAKLAADNELALVAGIQRLKVENSRHFYTAYCLDMECKSKAELINAQCRDLKSRDYIIIGLHRELRSKDDIIKSRDDIIKSRDDMIADLRRHMATNNALEDLTTTIKRRRPAAP